MMSPETRQLSGELIKESGGLSAAVAHLLCVTDVLRDVERRGPDVGVFAQVNERFIFFYTLRSVLWSCIECCYGDWMLLVVQLFNQPSNVR